MFELLFSLKVYKGAFLLVPLERLYLRVSDSPSTPGRLRLGAKVGERFDLCDTFYPEAIVF